MNCPILMRVRKAEFSSVIQGASNESTAYVTAVIFQRVVSLETFFEPGCRKLLSSMISGLRRGVNEIFALVGCYTSWDDSDRRFETTYRPNLQGSSSPKRMP